MEYSVKGCSSCPFFYTQSVTDAFCRHPAHEHGEKYIPVYTQLPDNYKANFCPLEKEPILIKKINSNTTSTPDR